VPRPREDVDAYEFLSSGEAWDEFCEALKERGKDLLRPTAPKSPVDVAEGHRYLAQMVRSCFELIMEGGDPARPWLFTSLHETMKIGWDNPDNIHTNARLSGKYTYRLSGTRGDAYIMSIAIYGGSFGGGGGSTENFVYLDELEIEPDGSFEIFLSPSEQPKNWVKLTPATKTMMIRQTFTDRTSQTPARLHIERVDEERQPPPPLTPEFVVGALRRSAAYIRGTNQIFFDWSDLWKTRPNTFWESDDEAAAAQHGIPGQYYASGYWMQDEDEAIVIDIDPPDCRYWAIVLSNYWGQSLDYRYRQVDVNMERAVYRADGTVRVIQCRQDPKIPGTNWLDTEGHSEGVWTLRYLFADRHPLPKPRVVRLDELASLD
jgi:hypothetical protein